MYVSMLMPKKSLPNRNLPTNINHHMQYQSLFLVQFMQPIKLAVQQLFSAH